MNLKKKIAAMVAVAVLAVPVFAYATDYYTVRTQDEFGRDIEVIVAGLQSNIDGKMAVPSGSSSQYLKGDASLATLDISAVSGLATALSGKLAIPAGTTSQVVLGDGTLGTLPSIPTLSFNNTPSHTIVTTAAAANGFQLSTTRNTSVYYSVNISTTATIGGASDGYVVLEIATTNSTTASDWKEVSRSRNGQTITLAIALQSVQNVGSELMNIVPAGSYARLRSVNTSGTPTFSFTSGQEVQL